MIEKVHIKNFQKHKDLKLKLKKGLNAIVGPTDSGKSAIFRALNFCLWNSFKGVNIVRNGEKFAEVTCTIHGKEIKRIKGASKNLYEVDGLELKAFGAGLPEEVGNTTRLGDINIQAQHDPIFLLNDSPGAVARYLNKLINIDIIDKTMSSLNSVQLEAGREVSFKNNEASETADNIAEVKFVKKCRKFFDSINLRFNSLEDQEAELQNVEKHVAELKSIPEVVDLEPMKNKIRGLEKTIEKSQELILEGQAIVKLVQSYPEISPVNCGEFWRISEDFNLGTEKAYQLRLIRDKIKEHADWQVMKSKGKKLLESTKKELEEACKICPTCGQEWH